MTPRPSRSTGVLAALAVAGCLAAGCGQLPAAGAQHSAVAAPAAATVPAAPAPTARSVTSTDPALAPSGIYYAPDDARWLPPELLPDYSLHA